MMLTQSIYYLWRVLSLFLPAVSKHEQRLGKEEIRLHGLFHPFSSLISGEWYHCPKYLLSSWNVKTCSFLIIDHTMWQYTIFLWSCYHMIKEDCFLHGPALNCGRWLTTDDAWGFTTRPWKPQGDFNFSDPPSHIQVKKPGWKIYSSS